MALSAMPAMLLIISDLLQAALEAGSDIIGDGTTKDLELCCSKRIPHIPAWVKNVLFKNGSTGNPMETRCISRTES